MLRDFPDDFEYVLGLQEASVVGMADGYAQATQNAAFVNLHSAAGVGNAMGNIYTAFKNQTPMVIVAGQQSRSIQQFDAYLNARRATELAQPYVKWSVEPARAEDVPAAIARAYYTAMQAPRGPVLVSVPADDWDAPGAPVPFRQVVQGNVPSAAAIQDLAAAVAGSARTALLVGAGIDRENAWGEAVELAERCGAGVFVAPLAARCGFPENHVQFQGFLPAVRAQIRERLEGYDLVLVVGAPAFTYHVAGDGPHLPVGARLVLLTDDPEAATWAPDGMALVCGVRAGLQGLLSALPVFEPVRAPPPVRAAPAPVDPCTLSVALVLQAIAQLRDPADVIVEEAPTARVVMHQHLPIVQPRTFVTMASGGLGFGMPAATGIALARTAPRVVCIIGDGSAMYSIQSLWTAAQYQLDVTFVVLNNRRYAALKRFAGVLDFPADAKLVGIDIPGLDFVGLAQGHGCPAIRLDSAVQLQDVLATALRRKGPMLVEAMVA